MKDLKTYINEKLSLITLNEKLIINKQYNPNNYLDDIFDILSHENITPGGTKFTYGFTINVNDEDAEIILLDIEKIIHKNFKRTSTYKDDINNNNCVIGISKYDNAIYIGKRIDEANMFMIYIYEVHRKSKIRVGAEETSLDSMLNNWEIKSSYIIPENDMIEIIDFIVKNSRSDINNNYYDDIVKKIKNIKNIENK